MLSHPQLKIWLFIQQCLTQQKSCALLYVLESKGSSPGRQGFCMSINEYNEMVGSIGGGMMEHKLVELAKEQINKAATLLNGTIKKQIHRKDAEKQQSGMICSGEQTVFIYVVQQSDLQTLHSIINCLQEHKQGLLTINNNGIGFSETIVEYDFQLHMQNELDWQYKEKLGYKNQLYVVGGGHCSLAFCKLMSSMDFYIHLFEDRKELNTFLENDFVHEKTVVTDYSALQTLIPSGKTHYVVIMTFGYRTDDIALKALINKNVAYLGVLGSKSKINKMFEAYQHQTMDNALLQSIYAPIGLPIHSKTPEEIAISIAAEIIQVKNA